MSLLRFTPRHLPQTTTLLRTLQSSPLRLNKNEAAENALQKGTLHPGGKGHEFGDGPVVSATKDSLPKDGNLGPLQQGPGRSEVLGQPASEAMADHKDHIGQFTKQEACRRKGKKLLLTYDMHVGLVCIDAGLTGHKPSDQIVTA
jgi:hypothetical protein